MAFKKSSEIDLGRIGCIICVRCFWELVFVNGFGAPFGFPSRVETGFELDFGFGKCALSSFRSGMYVIVQLNEEAVCLQHCARTQENLTERRHTRMLLLLTWPPGHHSF